jgi:chromosome segregation ATPase
MNCNKDNLLGFICICKNENIEYEPYMYDLYIENNNCNIYKKRIDKLQKQNIECENYINDLQIEIETITSKYVHDNKILEECKSNNQFLQDVSLECIRNLNTSQNKIKELEQKIINMDNLNKKLINTLMKYKSMEYTI